LFDNSKSEDFDVFPFRFWNISERSRKNYFKTINIGAEFFHFLMETYFTSETLKNLDIKTIIENLKTLEADCNEILKCT
jgi:hypothetical protein